MDEQKIKKVDWSDSVYQCLFCDFMWGDRFSAEICYHRDHIKKIEMEKDRIRFSLQSRHHNLVDLNPLCGRVGR